MLRIFFGNQITTATIVLVALLLISGTQFTLFAMWFDHGVEQGIALRPFTSPFGCSAPIYHGR